MDLKEPPLGCKKYLGKFLEIIIGDHTRQVAIIPGILTTNIALLSKTIIPSGAHISICAQSCAMKIVPSA
jgi:hypothetical protein